MMTIEQLQRKIYERRVREGMIQVEELGSGVTIEKDGGLVFVCANGERAYAGYYDGAQEQWVLLRDWFIELTSEFGALPSYIVIEQ